MSKTLAPPRSREELYRIILSIYKPFLQKFPGIDFAEMLQERYNVRECMLMSLEQIEDLVWLMQDGINGGDL